MWKLPTWLFFPTWFPTTFMLTSSSDSTYSVSIFQSFQKVFQNRLKSWLSVLDFYNDFKTKTSQHEFCSLHVFQGFSCSSGFLSLKFCISKPQNPVNFGLCVFSISENYNDLFWETFFLEFGSSHRDLHVSCFEFSLIRFHLFIKSKTSFYVQNKPC